jgi:hypothetical protein
MLGSSGADNIHHITQPEADTVIKNIQKEWEAKYNRDRESALGCVVWILNAGLKVDVATLQKARQVAVSLSEDKDYLDEWSGNRYECLLEEIAQIDKAIELQGQGASKHVKGLFERMSDKLG